MSLWVYSYESLETNDTSELVDKEGFVDWTGIGLAVLSVLLLSVKIVFGDVPTFYRFVHVVCGKNRYLLDYFYILVYRIMGRKEEESQVVHFGKYVIHWCLESWEVRGAVCALRDVRENY